MDYHSQRKLKVLKDIHVCIFFSEVIWVCGELRELHIQCSLQNRESGCTSHHVPRSCSSLTILRTQCLQERDAREHNQLIRNSTSQYANAMLGVTLISNTRPTKLPARIPQSRLPAPNQQRSGASSQPFADATIRLVLSSQMTQK